MKNKMNSRMDIVLTASDFYAPFMSVTMASILSNTPKNRDLFFHIITEDFSEKNKIKIMELKSIREFDIEWKHISCREMNIPLAQQKRVSDIAYARLYTSSIFPSLEKCVIVDSDLVIDCNLQALYDIDLNDYVTAIAQDPLERGEKSWWEFLDVPEQYPYLNTGLILMNVSKFRSEQYEKKLSDNYEKYKEKLNYIDQDLIYMTCSEYNKVIDPEWNFLPMCYYSDPSLKKRLFKTAFVYHFGGNRKPWIYTDIDKAEVWWKYARRCPFYEEILRRLIDFRITQRKNEFGKADTEVTKLRQEFAQIHFPNINNHFAADERQIKLFFVMNHLLRFKAKKVYYRVKKAFAFGEKHKRYQAKYEAVKQLLREAKKLKGELWKV